MIIRKIEVKNFRSVREATLDCDNLIAIVGRNGAGKSTFLSALDIFYDTSANLTEEDYFDRDTGAEIEIRVTYGALREDEKNEFKPYIRNNELIVTKRLIYDNGRVSQRYYAAALQLPRFAQIRTISSKRDRLTALKGLIATNEIDGLGGSPRSADQAEEIMAQFEIDNPGMLQPVEKEEQFFGPKNIGGGKLDKYTKYVLVPAVREASYEVIGKKGAIYQILDMIIIRQINDREDIKKFKTEFENRVKQVYSSDNLTELPDLGTSISRTLERFAPGSKLNLNWDEIKPPEIQLPAARATIIEDNFEGEISRKGHGLQRALILTLLQHLAMTVPLSVTDNTTEDNTETQNSDTSGTESSLGPDLILAIEEPELYLHPSRCRYLSQLLLRLVEDPEMGFGNKNQIIYTTHSPYFVDLDRFNQIRKFKKISSPDSTTQQCAVTSFTLDQAINDLAKICNVDPADFTEDSFKARTSPIMNAIVNEGFFADVVVVVEGLSELGMLWKLQEILKKNWAQNGIVIVPANGKNNIDRPTIIFRGLSTPTYFIFDGDYNHLGKSKKEQATKDKNHRYLRLAGATIEDFPNTQIDDTWAVFKYDIEAEVEEAVTEKVFNKYSNEVAKQLEYDDPKRAIKNIDGAARLIELIYHNKHNIPTLEEIVGKITNLS